MIGIDTHTSRISYKLLLCFWVNPLFVSSFFCKCGPRRGSQVVLILVLLFFCTLLANNENHVTEFKDHEKSYN